MHPRLLLLPAVAVALLCGCSRAERYDDRISVTSDDDYFIAQGPYGSDQSVLISARVPEARVAGGAVTMTEGGREVVVASKNAWRGYTGKALTAEELELRQQRSRAAEEASRRLDEASRRLTHELQALSRSLVIESRTPSESDAEIGDAATSAKAAATEPAPSAPVVPEATPSVPTPTTPAAPASEPVSPTSP